MQLLKLPKARTSKDKFLVYKSLFASFIFSFVVVLTARLPLSMHCLILISSTLHITFKIIIGLFLELSCTIRFKFLHIYLANDSFGDLLNVDIARGTKSGTLDIREILFFGTRSQYRKHQRQHMESMVGFGALEETEKDRRIRVEEKG